MTAFAASEPSDAFLPTTTMGPKRQSAVELRERGGPAAVMRSTAVKAAQAALDAFTARVGDPQTDEDLAECLRLTETLEEAENAYMDVAPRSAPVPGPSGDEHESEGEEEVAAPEVKKEKGKPRGRAGTSKAKAKAASESVSGADVTPDYEIQWT
ncbi:hypothetical protein FIBSPDRAFT_891421 [Athelia psychrophila]|uniref:Uncharacterized protein n=1 Tax=Athelia psychrophila TaxID=1759441 RepID=A0A166JMW5_9AGAM|nr:hypothetical protein FIBSPDRAFT_891421 [Fibularhizoctonia sp. CBS 109695]